MLTDNQFKTWYFITVWPRFCFNLDYILEISVSFGWFRFAICNCISPITENVKKTQISAFYYFELTFNNQNFLFQSRTISIRLITKHLTEDIDNNVLLLKNIHQTSKWKLAPWFKRRDKCHFALLQHYFKLAY